MEREQIELVLSTGKTMFFTWLNNLMVRNQLKIDEENANILVLEPYPSTWFCIGREESTKIPFIGIQENMIPWFFETNWSRAVVDEQNGYLYLTCAESKDDSDFTLAIRTRSKRLKVFTHGKSEEDEKYLEFRVIKVRPNNEVEISEKVYKRCSLEFFTSKLDIVKPTEEDILRNAEVAQKESLSVTNESFSTVKFYDEE
jgi:hypothetical protein